VVNFFFRKVSKEEAQALANEWGCAFVECSGKHNENIEHIFQWYGMRCDFKLTILLKFDGGN
jgi:hypothetical protein